ncbi:MAG: DUF1232 domain-containing protein [Anaerolineales bacterium]|nr:DUF1232 domain-containing protein [Anaerolineales bacterium]
MNQETSITNYSKQPSFWQEVWEQVRLVYYLMLDREVPIYLKIIPLLSFLYLIFPLDLIPDFAVGLGQFDDFTVLLAGAKVFIELSPNDVVARYISRMRSNSGYDTLDQSDPPEAELESESDIIEGIIIEDSLED